VSATLGNRFYTFCRLIKYYITSVIITFSQDSGTYPADINFSNFPLTLLSMPQEFYLEEILLHAPETFGKA